MRQRIQDSEYDRTETIDPAERWFMDNYRVLDVAGFFIGRDTDMSAAQRLIARMRHNGFRGTYTHVFVRALALALTRHPECHFMLGRNRRVYPERVDLSLPVGGGEGSTPPLLIIEDAGRKPLPELASEIATRSRAIRGREPKDAAVLRRWGWFVPGFLRRMILRSAWSRVAFRRKQVGTFHISCLSEVDAFAPLIFPGLASIATTRVKDRVVAENGKVLVRPMTTIYFAADHRAFDGMRAQKLLRAISDILESAELEQECAATYARAEDAPVLSEAAL